MHDIAAEFTALDRMSTGELAERYADLHGQPCRTRHRAYLIRKIAWRLQTNAEGDLSERARRRAAQLADDAEVRVMAPKTIICPPQVGESATVTRPAPTFVAGSKWKQFILAIRDFGGTDGSDITAVLFARSPEPGKFKFQIDDVRLLSHAAPTTRPTP